MRSQNVSLILDTKFISAVRRNVNQEIDEVGKTAARYRRYLAAILRLTIQ